MKFKCLTLILMLATSIPNFVEAMPISGEDERHNNTTAIQQKFFEDLRELSNEVRGITGVPSRERDAYIQRYNALLETRNSFQLDQDVKTATELILFSIGSHLKR